MRIEELAPFCIRHVFGVRHVRKQEIEQRIFGWVCKFPVGIAPLAVILVEVAVDFSADHGIVTERHAAALAKKLARCAEQRVDGDVEFLREHLEHFGVRLRLAGFPAAHGLARHAHAFRHLVLGEVVLFADAFENFVGLHLNSFLFTVQIYQHLSINARNRLLRCVKCSLVLLFAIL